MQLNKGLIGSLCLAMAFGHVNAASEYPQKPIRWIVPNPPGGGADTAVRLIADTLSPVIAQTLIIENRPGAGTVIGADAAARSKPDGYTILTGDLSTFATNPWLFKKMAYDPGKDFKYVSLTTRYPLLLVARKNLPAENVSELIAYAKTHPGKLNFGTAGFGVPHHFALELLMEKTGARFTHIPFKGSAAALQNMMSQDGVDIMFLDIASGHQYVRGNAIKVYGIATSERFNALPEVPTLKEAGLDFEFDLWQGVAVPAATPLNIVDRLSRDIAKALSDPTLQSKMRQIGAEPVGSTPQQFKEHVEKERLRWGKLIAEKGISLE